MSSVDARRGVPSRLVVGWSLGVADGVQAAGFCSVGCDGRGDPLSFSSFTDMMLSTVSADRECSVVMGSEGEKDPTSLPEPDKGAHEIEYWRRIKEQEGVLSNRHYRYFYTDHFGLSYEFYKDKQVLDIGCGPRGSLEWAQHTRERVGLDPLADEYLTLGATDHDMQYCSAGSESIPYPDHHFDVVTSFNSLDHVDDLEQTINEIKRVTRPGGLFLLLSDVNHQPTPCEPICFSWDVVKRFEPEFAVEKVDHFEKNEPGMYKSIQSGELYDHSNPVPRTGVISAKFVREPDTD